MTHLTPLEVVTSYHAHDYTLQSLFDSRVAKDPDRPFVEFNDRRWSWGAFASAIERTAKMLIGRGVGKGERVAVMATNSDAHVLMLFALARIGAIMVPVNPEFGVKEAQYVMGHAGVSAVACSAETVATARAACADIKPAPWFIAVDSADYGLAWLMSLIEEQQAGSLPQDISADDTVAIIYSSGTTGFPKGVMHSQRNFGLAGERHLARVQLQPTDRSLCILPMFHINALFYSVASAVAAGSCLIIVPKFSASQFWRMAADARATQVNVIMAVSTILARRPRSEFVPEHTLRVVNGAPFTQEVLDVFLNEFGVERIVEGFGMTEIPGAFSNPYEGPHKVASMGRPGVHANPDQQWTQARVVDDEGRDLPDDTTGELVVKIPDLMQGYYRDPEQTRAAFRDGWFLTGDLVKRDADGYFWFVARKKDIIRRRGENVAGAELDRIIGEHPSVSEAAAIAVDSELGEDEILVVVVRKPGQALEAAEVRTWCAERLAPHKVPRFVVFAEALPHTPTHKVAKFMLKKDASLRERATDFAAQTAGAR
ncbi:MAG: AMP-binding protein [Proteobacteria bacterium]|nr:AMP-binding protein [Burkholderiales bacterium]